MGSARQARAARWSCLGSGPAWRPSANGRTATDSGDGHRDLACDLAPVGPPNGGTEPGMFVASGAVSDYGTGAFAGKDAAVPSPIIGLYHGRFTLTGQAERSR